MPDRVLVTGISGFLGGHVALQLLEAGYVVRGSVRDLRKAEKVRATLTRHGADPSRLEFVALDLSSDTGWADAMRDVRYLHHVASPIVLVMPRDPMDLIRPAVEGTTRALDAGFKAGVERVVLTASISCIMYGHGSARTAPFTASDWTVLTGGDVNAYVESKTRAERAAWEIAGRLGRTKDLVAINPGGILGPLLDDDLGASGSWVARMLNGSAPAVPRMGVIVADVRDVAALQLAAMTSPEAGGRRFPFGNGTYTLFEIAQMLRGALPERSRKLPHFEMPDWLVRVYATIDRDVRSNLGDLGIIRRTDALDAKALLGRPLIPAEETVIATGRSILAQNLA